MNNKELFDILFFWRKKSIEDALNDVQELKIDVFDPDLTPTQADKPSPHSSLTKAEVANYLRKGFKDKKRFVLSTVSNTNSMEPFIDSNTIVVLEHINNTNLIKQPIIPGDIIVWVHQNKTNIIHQVKQVSDSGKSFYIQGINNHFADGWIPVTKIKYRMVSFGYSRQEIEGD